MASMTRSTGSLQARIPPALRPAGSVVIGVVLALHGAAHSLAFLVQWKLMTSTDLSYQTTVLGGHVDLGDIGIRVVGLLWLVAAFGFIVVGVRVAGLMRLEFLSVATVTIFSLALCLLGLPEASAGIVIDAAILRVLALVWTIGARRAARLKG